MYMPYTYKFYRSLSKKICILSSQRENSLRIVYEHIQNDTIFLCAMDLIFYHMIFL